MKIARAGSAVFLVQSLNIASGFGSVSWLGGLDAGFFAWLLASLLVGLIVVQCGQEKEPMQV